MTNRGDSVSILTWVSAPAMIAALEARVRRYGCDIEQQYVDIAAGGVGSWRDGTLRNEADGESGM